MVYLQLGPNAGIAAAELSSQVESDGIRIHVVGPDRIRLVLHHDVDNAGVERTLSAFRRVVLEG